MKKKLILLAVLAVLSICLPTQGQPWSGSGIEGDPYLIEDANDMQAIGSDPNYWDAHFKLMNDIDLSRYSGTEFNIIGNDANAFTGFFDGDDNSISNFTYSDSTGDNIGIFGCVSDPNAEIRNVTLVNAYVDMNLNSSRRVGSLVGWLKDGNVRDCCALSVIVKGGPMVGGLIGRNDNGTILQCYVTGGSNQFTNFYGNVASFNTVTGGLVGINYGMIADCCTHESITVYSALWSGGLVGKNYGTLLRSHADSKTSNCQVNGGLAGGNYETGTISFCYATGQVDGIGTPGASIGGLVGANYGEVSNCYASGNISGITAIGGLIGNNGGGPTKNCYAVGVVSGGEYLGGLVGKDNGDGSYLDCFWVVNINPELNGIGDSSDPNVIAKPTSEMKQKSTFANWDFIETWGIEDNQTYPFLKLTYPVSDLNYDHIVNMLDLAILADHWLAGVE